MTGDPGEPSTAPSGIGRPGSSSAAAKPKKLGHLTQPYVVIVGGGQGGIALGARLRQLGVDVARLSERAVVLSNGKTLPADLVVYATGYGSMNGWAADLISPDVAAKVGMCWGLGSGTTKDPGPWEGELRNIVFMTT